MSRFLIKQFDMWRWSRSFAELQICQLLLKKMLQRQKQRHFTFVDTFKKSCRFINIWIRFLGFFYLFSKYVETLKKWFWNQNMCETFFNSLFSMTKTKTRKNERNFALMRLSTANKWNCLQQFQCCNFVLLQRIF